MNIYNYCLLFTNFFDLDLFLSEDLVLELLISLELTLLNSEIIFSASLDVISLIVSLIHIHNQH